MEKNVLWYSSEKFNLNEKPVRLIELFAGIGAQAKSLDNLGIKYEHYRVCEIDKYAIKSYNAVHHTNFETSDITKINSDYLGIVDTDKYNYIFTYSFPCTDLSLAGTQSGMSKEDWKKGKSTRSGLLWEVERLLDECYAKNGKQGLPQCLLMENVPQVISDNKKNGHSNLDDFTLWITKLESLGYTNFCKILDASEVGYPEPIPQHRERCFMISLLGNYDYTFPEKSKLNKRLKDLLEPVVDEKYYLSSKMIDYLSGANLKEDGFPRNAMWTSSLKNTNEKGVAVTVTTRAGSRASDNFVIDEFDDSKGLKYYLSDKLLEKDLVKPMDIVSVSYSNCRLEEVNQGFVKKMNNIDNNISPTITTVSGRNMGICVDDFIKETNKNAKHQQDLVQSEEGVCRTITADTNGSTSHLLKTVVNDIKDSVYSNSETALFTEDGNIKRYINSDIVDEFDEGTVARTSYPNGYGHGTRVSKLCNTLNCSEIYSVKNNYRIRKLTSKETWRLMGFEDSDWQAAHDAGVSEAQLYKQAGNSIVVNCLAAIFKNLI